MSPNALFQVKEGLVCSAPAWAILFAIFTSLSREETCFLESVMQELLGTPFWLRCPLGAFPQVAPP